MTLHRYDLEQLFIDQDADLVVDSLPALLAWAGKSRGERRTSLNYHLEWNANTRGRRSPLEVVVGWDLDRLAQRVPDLSGRTSRLSSGRTGQREHVAELAGYVLALCGISLLMPGRRIIGFNRGAAPDLLFDCSPNALRGVEVAARRTGGVSKLEEVGSRETGKARRLLDTPDVVEAWLSLWCREPQVALQFKVKP
jgi:hypothetical protein